MRINRKILSAAVLLAVALAPQAIRAQDEETPKVELGVQFTSLTLSEPFSFFSPGHSRTEPGFGGRIGYNLTDNFAVEGEVNFLPRGGAQPFTDMGGRIFQGQFGIKAGKRFERFGLFAKVRPGFVTFSDVREFREDDVIIIDGERLFRSSTPRRAFFSTDVGGVLEIYASRRILTRFDFGDTIIRHGERNTLVVDFLPPDNFRERLIRLPSETRHNFQFSAGLALRF